MVYGFPTAGLIAEAEAGRVVLGGCVVEEDSPDRRCRTCGHAWQQQAPVRLRRNPS